MYWALDGAAARRDPIRMQIKRRGDGFMADLALGWPFDP